MEKLQSIIGSAPDEATLRQVGIKLSEADYHVLMHQIDQMMEMNAEEGPSIDHDPLQFEALRRAAIVAEQYEEQTFSFDPV